MKKSPKKLQLSKETLRRLTNPGSESAKAPTTTVQTHLNTCTCL